MTTRTIVILGAAAAFALSACSSSGASKSPPAGGNSAVTISAKGGTLTGADGHTLYTNTVDTASSIKCVGTCATTWPPVTGTPKAGSGVTASDLGTAKRPDGSTQATYQGHPLYRFDGDHAAGDRKGDGLADQGGTWHVATTSGTAPSSAPSSQSSSPSYNY